VTKMWQWITAGAGLSAAVFVVAPGLLVMLAGGIDPFSIIVFSVIYALPGAVAGTAVGAVVLLTARRLPKRGQARRRSILGAATLILALTCAAVSAALLKFVEPSVSLGYLTTWSLSSAAILTVAGYVTWARWSAPANSADHLAVPGRHRD
jgi:hypothetical protein